jgi:hypothetical protein
VDVDEYRPRRYTTLCASFARRSSIILSATVSRASSHVIGTQRGSTPRPFCGLVRFSGTLIRSGSYTCCGIRWPRGQQ